MTTGICLWMSIAVRSEAQHSAEMVTQLIFGETYHVTETAAGWCKICTDDCGYEGWISDKQHVALSDEAYQTLSESEKYIVKDAFVFIKDSDTHIVFPIPMGAQIPCLKDKQFSVGNRHFEIVSPTSRELIRHEGLTEQQDTILSTAFQCMNAPYLWGGRTPAGIDCSGFVQIVFKCIGISLPRDASQQVLEGTVVDFLQEARIGDIAFFENEEGNIVHTGIVCGYRQIIHSSGFVQINTLDETGIFNQNFGKYTHKLRVIKRVL